MKAFKDARHNETNSLKNASEENQSKDTLCSDDASKLQHEETITSEQKEKEAKILAKKPLNNSKEKIAKLQHGPKAIDVPNSPSNPSVKNSAVHSVGSPKITNPKKKILSQTPQKIASESSVAINSDDEELVEEKEYFDDSTEERFYKQSSMSEDSDSGDDFFIGKVKRTRKKESSSQSSVREPKKHTKVLLKEDKLDTHQDVRDDLNQSSTEIRKFESIFFHSLSGSKISQR